MDTELYEVITEVGRAGRRAIALLLAIADHIREALRRRRLDREIEKAEAWIASQAAPTTPQTPVGPAGSPTSVGPAGSNESKVTR